MDLLDRRFLIVVGKGGVGKSTVATALALAAARRDKKVLLALVNSKERVSKFLGCDPVNSKVAQVAPNVDAVNMTPRAALEEYGLMILRVRAIYKAVFENRLVRAFLRGTPGLEAWSMLGKAFFHASPPNGEPEYDLVILDAPATGHALDMLRVPSVLTKVAPPGLLRREAERAMTLFRDEEQAGAVIVTLPEDMPVNESMDLHDALQDELQIPVIHLVVNRVLERLFSKDERLAMKELPAKVNAGSDVHPLAVAARRRALRETVQDRSIERVTAHIRADNTELPYRAGLENDRAVIESLSEAF